jgi:hypothetical protein
LLRSGDGVGDGEDATNVSAQDRVILFCVATGIKHAEVGTPAQAMQSMAIRGFIGHHAPNQVYALTTSGRVTLLENSR